MADTTILIIEDDEVAKRTAERSLEKHGFATLTAGTGEEGIQVFSGSRPSAILLDRGLPDIDGLEVCRRIRGLPGGEVIPIILLTAQDENTEIVEGLNAGADDYVTKPFNADVLASRIKAILRRTSVQAAAKPQEEEESEEDEDFKVSEDEPIVYIHGQEIHLDPLQYHILWVFYERRGMILGQYDLFEATRNFDAGTTRREIELSIDSLRELFAPYGNYLEHVVGIGYRLRD
ncbi:MAG: response regulator transcription factor [Bdellovibrionales bacterium]|nr:response regulator transcription factor [Bdellovibrionales bacterium]